MKNTKNQLILIGGAVVFRENRGKRQFLLVKQKKEDKDWEIAKVTVRKGESSVRSVIRLTGEQGGMSARVLEEAGRASGTTIINGKSIPQKFYYYLMLVKGGPSELIGFDEVKWLEYADAVKKLVNKRERDMLKGAKDVLKEWEKTHNLKKQEIQPF
jgi:8-oxo-dGTP pyrophosphatase MutT (NUDIX family)